MNNLIPTLKYLWLTTKHKYFVFRAGLKTGAPIWRLVIHDLSKFTPMEAPHYGRLFFGDKSDPVGYSQAWNHHAKVNPHHWEYWVPLTGGRCAEDLKPLPMPMWAVREMVADWCGASKAYEGFYPWEVILFGDWRWFRENWPNIHKWMHDETIQNLAIVMDEMFGVRASNEMLIVLAKRKYDE